MLREMQELTQRLWPSRWHIGDMAWIWFQHTGYEAKIRTARWERDGRTAAWAWANLPDGSLDLQLDPAHPELADEILTWFAETGGRTVTVLDDETAMIEALLRHGYQERTEGPFFLHLGRSLADPIPEPAVPDGYTLRHVRSEDDAEARVAVHRAAFTLPGGPPSKVTTESYRNVMRAWPYRRELDWFVTAPGGTPAAFCLVWLDERNKVAILEPVGTDPGHRRLGLASAAILGALRTARDLGAETARVCARGDDAYPSARATYMSVGFRRYARNRTFVRPENE
ncbi:GNAT family N-acetyltransferase [Spirillospora sp. NPDC048911]|uniref:GNAT family N-acetyltransferase n=1 Tax=Spirillospora sp. NPDC048911 TaxID=3364527 RepID=UPI00371B1093